MNINKTLKDDQLTIALQGRLDTNTAPKLESVLNGSLDGITALVFDFSELSYISSAGLRILLFAQKKMNVQGSMKVIGASDIVMEIFEVTGFSEILTIE